MLTQKKVATKIKVRGTATICCVEMKSETRKFPGEALGEEKTRSAMTNSYQRSDDKDAVVSGNEQRSQWNASLKGTSRMCT